VPNGHPDGEDLGAELLLLPPVPELGGLSG
jgi:hypothetical protein